MTDLQLVNYIKRHLEKGYAKPEIEKILFQNNWDKNEIKHAFEVIESKKKVTKEPIKKIQNKKEELEKTNFNQISTLKNFILAIRARKIDDKKIKDALIKKRWPEDLIKIAFSELKGEKPSSKTFIKPKVQRKPFNFKKLFLYILGFIILTAILAGTIFVYQYVVGLSSYEVIINGSPETGKCIELNCSDMKNFAFNFANENLILYFGISAIISLLIGGLSAFGSIRNWTLWGANILYFCFLIFIGYTWINFI
jgi:hypothetical protein